jgi:UDP-N-acetylglucosamine 1-carboxyvinyltransferase
MDKIVIEGGHRLIGEIAISGAKNSALPLMAATLLIDGCNTITNIPNLKDINTFKRLLEHLGCYIDDSKGCVKIDASDIKTPEAPYELVKIMRASILVLGPLVSRFKRAKVSLPGGCAIGARPINLHLMGLEKMGAKIKIAHGYVEVSAKKLKGANIYFDIPTVTGTENLMMAACLADGITVIENAAREPEVLELATALNKMGGCISGAGTETIRIEGVKKLNPIEYAVMPDRIEAGTYMIASAATRGNLLLKNCPIDLLEALSIKLKEAGTEIIVDEDNVRVIGNNPIRSVDIKTLPYPGFPTDLQAQMMSMMCIASGLSVLTETIFENRFMHVSELKRMGANIQVDGRTAIVKGRLFLSGAPVMATDLRASASLIIAALIGEAETEISRVYHLDRGYESIEEKLAGVGAMIRRIRE